MTVFFGTRDEVSDPTTSEHSRGPSRGLGYRSEKTTMTQPELPDKTRGKSTRTLKDSVPILQLQISDTRTTMPRLQQYPTSGFIRISNRTMQLREAPAEFEVSFPTVSRTNPNRHGGQSGYNFHVPALPCTKPNDLSIPVDVYRKK